MEWNMEELDFKDVIKDSLNSTNRLVIDKNIDVKVDIPDKLPSVYGDKDRLIQVMVNLISNAVKFCPETRGKIEIIVKTENSGIWVSVKDNGIGILPEDLPLAIQRYTTSKISRPEDLFCLRTLGFRGEALASMAAVSKLRLASRAQEQPWGREILVEGGRIKAEREIGLPVGTVVEVRDLFFNTPARRKFLKKDATELGHIYETVVRLSLAYPDGL
jgi:DNA mismatch repair protein MutL